jgi:hydrogenase/urease accessory protein HupE
MTRFFFVTLLISSLLLTLSLPLAADVVRPALVEISVDARGSYRVEIRASVEALLTGINAKYKNTQDSPNAQAYDDLRVLPANQLIQAFEPFRSDFTKVIKLLFDSEIIPMHISTIEIPEPGYTKVPRISLIVLEGEIDRSVQAINWYYPAAFGDNAVRVRQVDEANDKWHWSEWQWLRKDEMSTPFSLDQVFTRQPISQVIGTYVVAGFEHILPKGVDHILFILGIFLLSTRMRPLLEQVTMFTVAHSITLGLAMNGIIYLPANIVEPLIALSIAYIGIENILSKELHKSRLLIVFGFGLLHGMGFASVLNDFGMPDDAFMTALISFNVGVELGQISVIMLAFLSVGVWFRNSAKYRPLIIIPGSLVISLVGLYWTWDRIVF